MLALEYRQCLCLALVIHPFLIIHLDKYQGRIREEGMQQSTSKNRMGGGTLLEKYSNI